MTRKFTADRLLVATHNAGKLEEIREILAPYEIKIVGAGEMGLAEPEETEDTFVGNARIKARSAVNATGLPCMADDSGIEIDALNGAPGVYTADWAQSPNGRDFMQAMQRARDELMASAAPQPWTARFRATLVMAWPDEHEEVFEGACEGILVWPVRGALGHGYDPMFQPAGHAQTFAEMTHDRKNRLSHRGAALNAFVRACFE